jgi:hypothetical protein
MDKVMKVSREYYKSGREVPQVRIRGKWLKDLGGFEKGNYYNIHIDKDEIKINRLPF